MNLSEILSERLVQALGWTILHTLWQGGAIAILLGVSMIVMRKFSSHVRYFVSVSALLTMFILSVVTFVSYYRNYQPPIPSDFTLVVPVFETAHAPSVERASNTTVWQVLWQGTETYFQQHLPLVVSVWFLGIVLLVLRFLGGYAYVQRLKHYQVREVNAYWQGTLAYLAAEVGVKRHVKLLESALAEVPMVVGWLKPVILLPVGTLTGLSIAQVESILAHELAHLKRHDYLVNIVQSMLEIVLFYNPFVWWVSGYIRQERENCCDDIAVEVTGDSLTLVKTLTLLEEFRVVKPQLAMGFAGRGKGGLLSRVRRLLSPRRNASGFSEGFLSAMVLVFCLGITTANAYTPYNWKNFTQFANKSWEKIQNVASNLVGKPKPPAPPMTPEPPQHPSVEVAMSAEGMRIRTPFNMKSLKRIELRDTIRFGNGFVVITEKNGQVKVFKEGKEIPKTDFEKYKNDFSIVETPKSNSFKKRPYIYINGDDVNIDLDDLDEALPPMPALPAMPAMPALPAMPPFVWNDGEEVYVIENGKKVKRKIRKQAKRDAKAPRVAIAPQNAQEWERWGADMERWGEEWGKKWEGSWGKEWGEKMERWGESMERWGEKFGKQYENYENLTDEQRKEMEKSMEKLREEQEKLHEEMEKLQDEKRNELEKIHEKERERREEVLERHREATEKAREKHREVIEKHREAIDKAREDRVKVQVKSVLEILSKDGLANANDKKLKIKVTQKGIEVNGKKLTDEQEARLRPILAEKLGIPTDKSKKHDWTWEWEDDEK